MALLVVANEPLFYCICLAASLRVAASFMVNLVLLVHASFLCESLCFVIVVHLYALPLRAVVLRLQPLFMLLCYDVCLSLMSLLAAWRTLTSFSVTFVLCRL